MKERIYFKNPDMPTPENCDTEEKQEAFRDAYSEYGEYFMFELDLETLTGRLLPRSEWKE